MRSDDCLLIFLKEKYNFYNKKIFNNLLPVELIIKIVPYKKKFIARVVGNFNPKTTYFDRLHIEFTNFYLFTEDELIDILLHEMIHVYDCKINNGPEYGAHNRKFRKLMYGINLRFKRNISLTIKDKICRTS